uniref:U46-Deinotoxin-Dsu1a_1 n=1 Tax=Deinopis subrufa TaxID=1905329 RepID=A0A4V2H8W3_DEISU
MELELILVYVALLVLTKGESEPEEEILEKFFSEDSERGCALLYKHCKNSVCCVDYNCKCNYYGWWDHKCHCQRPYEDLVSNILM